MKAIIAIMGAISLLCPYVALGQGSPVYDNSYRGPVNGFGQPAYTVIQRQQQQNVQPRSLQHPQGLPYPGQAPQYIPGVGAQQHVGGLVGAAYNGLSSAGSYFWNYMPAPVRGPQAQFQSPQGDVSIIYVPGTR